MSLPLAPPATIPPEYIPQGDFTGAVPGAHHGLARFGAQVQSGGLEALHVTPIVRSFGEQLVVPPGMKAFSVYQLQLFAAQLSA